MTTISSKLISVAFLVFLVAPVSANHIFPEVVFSKEDDPSQRFFETCDLFSEGTVEILSAARVAPIDIYKSGNGNYFTHHPAFGCAGPFDLGAKPKIYERYQPWFEEWVLTLGSSVDGRMSITFGDTVFVASTKMPPE
ncbi:MAG: hypothetical protein JXR15_04285 [Shimia sp.]|uniref:hypothetical protein n=1 Tax=Shimia sp. TaxID=1954381 RepID=UPI003B8D3101